MAAVRTRIFPHSQHIRRAAPLFGQIHRRVRSRASVNACHPAHTHI